jgi:hypothetical protein
MEAHTVREPEVSFPVYGNYMAAVLAMLPCLLFRPGVGLNAGAQVTNKVTQEDVSEFLDDVTVLSPSEN